jgi:hypothetical protein
MRRALVVSVILACLAMAGGRPLVGTLSAAGDPNAYFNALIVRGDAWKSNSLRNQTLIDNASTAKPNPWITYDASQDAAKAVIPPFVAFVTIASVGPDRITFSRALTTYEKNLMAKTRGLRVDNDIMTVMSWTTFGDQFADADTSLLVNRGQFGTAVSTHAPGATAYLSQNNLLYQARVPLGTADGNTYLITWDVKYDSSYLGNDVNVNAVGHKEFQLAAGARGGGIWLETRTRADSADGIGKTTLDRTQYVSLIDGRYYADASATYSGLTSTDTIRPQAGRFYVQANVWTRFWWFIEQRANDYDVATLWVADEVTDPVKIFDGLRVNARADANGVATIGSWWFEQNTSYDLYRGSTRDLVTWTRNFVALQNPGDVSSLLLRPLAGAPTSSPTSGPKPPTNLRIVTQ